MVATDVEYATAAHRCLRPDDQWIVTDERDGVDVQ